MNIDILHVALSWSATISLYSHAGGYVYYYAHSSTHQSDDTKEDIFLKDVIWALSKGGGAK